MPSDSDQPASANAAPSRRRVFALRLGSTIVLWALLSLAIIFQSPWIFFVMITGIVAAGLVEYFGLFQDAGRRRFRWQTYAVGLVYTVALFAPQFGFAPPWLRELDAAAIALLVILIILSRLHRPLEGIRTLDEITVAIFGFVYIPVLFGFLTKILGLELVDASGADSSRYYVLYLLAVTKFTDMGAYAIGSLIGRHKMVPHVSPGKTWQGFGGAIFGAFVASFGSLALFGERIPLITSVHAVGLALALSLVAVLGDLSESIIKRGCAAKDSGHKMPGIGGVLDLIDSVLFTAPVMYFYLLVILS